MHSRPWHTLSLRTCADELKTNIRTGLTTSQVSSRLRTHGLNELPAPKKDSLPRILARQFKSPLVYLLVGAAIIAYSTGHPTDATFVVIVLLFNAIVGGIQEGRANNALAALTRFVKTQATVLRNGKEIIIPDTELLPGDIVLLKEGEKVGADMRIIHTEGLRIDQSSLTGESAPVSKSSLTLRGKKISYPDQTNMAFKGTLVVAGVARGIVVETGIHTAIGAIGQTLAHIEREIPLQKNLRHLSVVILFITLGICAVVIALGLARGMTLGDVLLIAISLSVSVIPEGLPVVLTIVLATGVRRMAKRHALIKRLQAVESLGQADVIAVDKTGTITKNQLVVRSIFTEGALFRVTGEGYNTEGDAIPLNHRAPYEALDRVLTWASLSSNAHVMMDEKTQQWMISGDPTEAALTVASHKRPLPAEANEKQYPRTGELPFDYRARMRATFHQHKETILAVVSGAPESILERTTHIQKDGTKQILTRDQRRTIEQQINASISKGLRVIALATTEYTKSSPLPTSHNDLNNLTFEGFFAMEDTLREGVKEAVQQALRAGIRVVMITGDHALTAKAIAREAGIYLSHQRILTGEDLEHLSDYELKEALGLATVIARVLPEQKMRIIQGYHARGEIVAMTGDGVNDAPALAAADLGVAMGVIGSDVAKEAADIILVDDNFKSIVAAVREGRAMYVTIQRVVLYLFSTNAGEVMTLLGALALGLPVPLFASQILWLNLITDGFLDVALAREPSHSKEVPRKRSQNEFLFIGRSAVFRLIIMAGIMGIGTLILYHQHLADNFAKSSTLVLTTLAIFQWANAWNCRSHDRSIFFLNPFKNLWLINATLIVVALQLFAVYSPFMNRILHTTPLSAQEWLTAALVASSIIVVEEVRKVIAAVLKRKRSTPYV